MAGLKKIIGGLGGIAVVMIASVVGIAEVRYDMSYETEWPQIEASQDPDIIARGEYLVWGPGHCAGCHGAVDQIDHYEETGERIPLTGGAVMRIPPGDIVVPNITQDEETGIGGVSDGQIARALRYSVGRHGTQLFPVMPFANLSDEDLTAIVSYLRTVEAVVQERPERDLSLLGKVLFAFVMEPLGPSEPVAEKVEQGPNADYGEYLARNVANCYGCHTDRSLVTGEFFGEAMGGGLQLAHKGRTYTIPNITPRGQGSRLAGHDEAGFIKRMRTGRPSVAGSPMPWAAASQMTEDDLKALWAYFSSLPPVDKDTGPVVR